jgi:hypothetical protein
MPKADRCEGREIETWDGFEGAIRELSCEQKNRAKPYGPRLPELLFRGLGNSEWGLETTLERSYLLDEERCDDTLSLRKYYHKASTAKSAVETLSGRRFKIPNVPEFDRLVSDNFSVGSELTLLQKPAIYEYLAYLRHHGFLLRSWIGPHHLTSRLFSLSTRHPGTRRMYAAVPCRGTHSQGGPRMPSCGSVGST